MQLKIEIHTNTVLKENVKTKATKMLNFDLSNSIADRVPAKSPTTSRSCRS